MTKVYLLGEKLLHVGDWIPRFEPNEEGALLDSNPLPEGAIEADMEVLLTANGTSVLASDYEALRRAEYPPIRDQLDAIWKGGEALTEMASLVQAVKDKYPKP